MRGLSKRDQSLWSKRPESKLCRRSVQVVFCEPRHVANLVSTSPRALCVRLNTSRCLADPPSKFKRDSGKCVAAWGRPLGSTSVERTSLAATPAPGKECEWYSLYWVRSSFICISTQGVEHIASSWCPAYQCRALSGYLRFLAGQGLGPCKSSKSGDTEVTADMPRLRYR